uniref:Uncharacterized protein n=1 Tax=Arundo donax TaxID=35708 RepID=A0A0A9AX57_ARUDO
MPERKARQGDQICILCPSLSRHG